MLARPSEPTGDFDFTSELREAVRPKFFRLKSYLLTLASIMAVFGILAIFFLVDGAYELKSALFKVRICAAESSESDQLDQGLLYR